MQFLELYTNKIKDLLYCEYIMGLREKSNYLSTKIPHTLTT